MEYLANYKATHVLLPANQMSNQSLIGDSVEMFRSQLRPSKVSI
jgi:hypothetical protein